MEKQKVEEELSVCTVEKRQCEQQKEALNKFSEQVKKRLDELERQQQLLLQEKRHTDKLCGVCKEKHIYYLPVQAVRD